MLLINVDKGVAVLMPNGPLSEDDFKTASHMIDLYLETHDKLKGAVIYTKSFPGWDSFGAMLTHFRFIKDHQKLLKRVAICTDSAIGEFADHVVDYFVSAEVKQFDYDDFEDAKKWAGGGDVAEVSRHGISIGMFRAGDEYFMSMKVVGTLTHADYEKINPILDAATVGMREPKIKILVDLSEFDGWEARAAWDDFSLGLKHGNHFEKLAIYGHKNWQDIAAKIGSWFIGGEMKAFKDRAEALEWLKSDEKA